MYWLGALLAVCVLVPNAHCAGGSIEWCYHEPECNDTTWPTIVSEFCNGSRQSPIDIVSASAQVDPNLTAFTFTNFDSTSSLDKISNTGKTVKVTIKSGVGLSGGGLESGYDSLQFHLHWGNGTSVPGSEHTVDGKRYPMELHIVNIKSIYNGDTDQALLDSTGFAALGFFIEEMSGDATGQPASWNILSSYLAQIPNISNSVSVTNQISLNDLLSGVNRTRFYRYLGSLTTPTCNEAVVWTVFKETIKVSRDVIDKFSQTIYVTNSSSSPLMVNTFRGIQPALTVTTSAAAKTYYSLWLMALGVLLGSTLRAIEDDTTWPTIVPEFCNGSQQSPIDIVSASAQVDSNLTAFTFTNYNSTSSLDKIVNTGNTVRIAIKSGVGLSGGGLETSYDGLQFHLHWGNGTSVPGSEHTVDGKRYPMELHIVNIKSIHNGDIDQALMDSTGFAALGFFIEEMSGDATGQPASWNILSSYLAQIPNISNSAEVTDQMSLDDLLSGVDRTKFYRYFGSLTTPTCNEAVVWTVFKETIKVSRDVIDKFSQTIYVTNSSSSPLMVNTFRGIQPALTVTTSAAAKTYYSLWLMALGVLLGSTLRAIEG
ncbi:uncharacterized protein [Clinocottus analis]|uniref:uncharacterized protein n=1 Tax=Clinocottus analis TaxID=304258 RepID=UPI0035C1A689